MLTDTNAYDLQMLNELKLEDISEQEISEALESYLGKYDGSFARSQQKKYFEAFEKVDRMSVEAWCRK